MAWLYRYRYLFVFLISTTTTTAEAAAFEMAKPLVLIVGVGDGLSASLARLFHQQGCRLAFAARNTDKLNKLAVETEAVSYACDATNPQDVINLFSGLKNSENLHVVIFNPSLIVRGPITEVDPEEVRKSMEVTAFGSFLVGQQAAKLMLQRGKGTILFTGASAGVKGFPRSAAFAMGKFAQRGLAESMARELHPQNIHVCWINIDGVIRNPGRTEETPDSMLDPDAIARTYWNIVNQDRSAWSSEVAVRPWTEKW
jgi:NAD(P)-dependent dehydrogenase (short-subunit alcohol dehydrogenase family)